MQKITIPNRDSKRICVYLDLLDAPRGLFFLMHGLGKNAEQTCIAAFCEVLVRCGYSVVRFDARDSDFGESEGRYRDATVTGYLADLECVIAWAQGQSWFQSPFGLAGHSLGGLCTGLYAEAHAEDVGALVALAAVVSGDLRLAAYERYRPEVLATWRETGMLEEASASVPGYIRRIPWSHMLDNLRYNLLPEAHRIACSVLLMGGGDDTSIPPEALRAFYDALTCDRTLHIIPHADHNFHGDGTLEAACGYLAQWVGRIG